MTEVKLKEKQELWKPQEVDNSVVLELEDEPECGGAQGHEAAGPTALHIKEEPDEPEELQIKQESIQVFPVIVSVWSEKEEALLHETMKKENREDRDGESSSDTDDSEDWTPSAESPTAQTHEVERPFKCSVCAAVFKRNDCLEEHLKAHTREIFRCSVCSRSYTTESRLTAHMATHTGEIPFRCPVCAVSFLKYWHLTAHMRKHKVKRPFSCPVCSKTFKDKGAFEDHMEIHRETGVAPNSEPWGQTVVVGPPSYMFSNTFGNSPIIFIPKY